MCLGLCGTGLRSGGVLFAIDSDLNWYRERICLAVGCINTHTHTHILQAERDVMGHERGREKGRKPPQKGVGKEGDSVSEFVPRIIIITVRAISRELVPPIVSRATNSITSQRLMPHSDFLISQ